ncbi:MAG: hypothetical protein IPM60_11355 [Rhodospirillales bacterium]|nr:hypothetical protein [Rhodospirillales bacterium]
MMLSNDKHPPRARLALRVGVTGHRPNKLDDKQDAVVAGIRTALAAIEDALSAIGAEARAAGCYRDEDPMLRVVSPLAEGADRMVAHIGLERGYDLQAVLPFAADAYEEDFADERSKAAFRDLISKASAVLTLGGDHQAAAARDRAYRDCGLTVLRQCDVLIAIWDGEEAVSSAGTGGIVADALALGVPVLWIDVRDPASGPRLLEQIASPGDGGAHTTVPVDRLDQRLRMFLLPPDSDSSSRTKRHGPAAGLTWRTYFAEPWPRWSLLAPFYTLFVALFSWTWIRPSATLPSFSDRLASPQRVTAAIDRRKEHYLWADQLADYYAGAHRGSFVLGFTLAPVAVLFALLAFGLGDIWPWVKHAEMLWTIGELVVIVLILALVLSAQRRRWHERWIEYRFLAEQFRLMDMLAPLGRAPGVARFPAHHDFANPSASFARWHFHAVVREAGLHGATLDEPGRQAFVYDVALPLIRDQAAYHKRTAHRSERVAHALHLTHVLLFALTFVVVAAHLAEEICHCLPSPFTPSLLSMLAAVLPAFGASFAARSSQGEFHRLAQRSEALSARLDQAADQLAKTPSSSSAALGDLAESAANLMVEEVLDWRVLFLARPPELPA